MESAIVEIEIPTLRLERQVDVGRHVDGGLIAHGKSGKIVTT
jgi:hypothetical protein